LLEKFNLGVMRIFLTLVIFLSTFFIARAQILDTVTFCLKWNHQFEFAGIYAAIDQGYFTEEGLAVDLKVIRNIDKQLEYVLKTPKTYGILNSDLLLRRLNGNPVVLVMPTLQHSSAVFYVFENSRIKHPHGLFGKKIMMGNHFYPELYLMMKKEGIDPSISAIDSTWVLDDFLTHKVDAILNLSIDIGYMPEPDSIRMLYPLDYGVDLYGECIFTSEREIKNNPHRVEAFRRAVVRGWEYALENPGKLAELIISKYDSTLSMHALNREYEEMRKLMLPNVIEIGHNNRGRWEMTQDELVKYGYLKESKSLEGFFYEDYYRDQEIISFQVIVWVGVGMLVLLLLVLAQWFINKRLSKLVSVQTAVVNSHNEELRKTNSELDNFVYHVSHDLRTPLNSTLGLIKLYRADEHADPDEYLEMINNNLLRLEQFIRDILHYSRNTRTEIETEVIDLEHTIVDIIEGIKHTSDGIQTEVQVEGCATVRVDPIRIKILLNNLITNSYKYADFDKEIQFVEVYVHCRGDQLNIVVRDNGVGISENLQPRVFEMFYRANDKTEGSGLGLYIVHEIIEKLQGSIRLESTVGRGTAVYVSLPVMK